MALEQGTRCMRGRPCESQLFVFSEQQRPTACTQTRGGLAISESCPPEASVLGQEVIWQR